MEISILGFILMTGAALLGFSIAWLFQRQKLAAVKSLEQKKQRAYDRLREEYDVLIKHSNSLQAEKLKLQEKIQALSGKLHQEKAMSHQLEDDKEFIFKEYENFRSSMKHKLESSRQVLAAFESLKEKNQKVKLKTDKLRVKYHETVADLQKIDAEFRNLKSEKDRLQEELKNNRPESSSIFEWESNYKELKLRYLALAKEKKDLEARFEKLFTEKEKSDKVYAELKSLKRVSAQLEKENQVLTKKLGTFEKSIPKEDKQSVLFRIGRKKDKVDFGRIGEASPTHKDNLQLIKGIGPFIEQKLNALGIFHFQQIAHFQEHDISEINYIIELPPGHIQMDDWVGQASRMK